MITIRLRSFWLVRLLSLAIVIAAAQSCGLFSDGKKAANTKKKGNISLESDSLKDPLAVGFKLYCKYPYTYNSLADRAAGGVITCDIVDSLSGSIIPAYVEPDPVNGFACRAENGTPLSDPGDYFRIRPPAPSYVAEFLCNHTTTSGNTTKADAINNNVYYNCVDGPILIEAFVNRTDVDKKSEMDKQGTTINEIGYFQIDIPAETGFNCLAQALKTPTTATSAQATLSPTYIGDLNASTTHECLSVEFAQDVTDENGTKLPFVFYDKTVITYRIRVMDKCL